MPRREGDVFFFGTAIEITPEIGAPGGRPNCLGRRAYRGSVCPRLVRPPQTVGGEPGGPRLVNRRDPPHARPRPRGTAHRRIGQDCRKERGLPRGEVTGRLPEGMPRGGLCAE